MTSPSIVFSFLFSFVTRQFWRNKHVDATPIDATDAISSVTNNPNSAKHSLSPETIELVVNANR